jgi:hypothetical protein
VRLWIKIAIHAESRFFQKMLMIGHPFGRIPVLAVAGR